YYPSNVHVTGIDFSPKMLAKAEEKIERVKAKVILREMDAEKMDFPDNTFDNVVSTCVFCSVPDPDRKSTRLNSSHVSISYAVFCLKKKNNKILLFLQAESINKFKDVNHGVDRDF